MPPSPRNPSFVSFTSEKSQFLSGGPLRILRPAVPSWPIVFGMQVLGLGTWKKQEGCSESGLNGAGANENMFGLNHWLGSPVITVLGS